MASVYGVVDVSETQSEPNLGHLSRTASPPFVTEIISAIYYFSLSSFFYCMFLDFHCVCEMSAVVSTVVT